jgi:osmoprotectant transport system substrate-binding protein
VVSCIIAAGLSLAGCVSDGPPPPLKGNITIGARDFPESVLLANMYSAVLERAGFEVEIKYDCDRKKCLEDLDGGEVDLVSEYLGSLTGSWWSNKTVRTPSPRLPMTRRRPSP